jgi:hypothetical protein
MAIPLTLPTDKMMNFSIFYGFSVNFTHWQDGEL